MNIIGIDLGTTNSVVARFNRGETEVVSIEGRSVTPSIIYLGEGEPEVGIRAARRQLIDPERVLSSTKRFMGENKKWKIDGKTYTPVDAAHLILAYLKKGAEETLGGEVKRAVITVPAYFTEAQRSDTRQAAEMAGLEVLQLMPEPTAAAIAYGLDSEKNQRLMVFDLGGGTFDVSILEVQGNSFQVCAVDGNSKLGGDDLDQAMIGIFLENLQEEYGKLPKLDAMAKKRLKEAAEAAKIALAEQKATEIELPQLAVGIDLVVDRLTRKQFGERIEPLIEEMLLKSQGVIKDAGLSPDDLSRIVLVGGSCKHPLIRDAVSKHFREPFQAPDMDTYVARGAAIACADLMRPSSDSSEEQGISIIGLPEGLSILNCTGHSYGVDMRIQGGFLHPKLVMVPILPKQTAYPARGGALGVTETKFTEQLVMTIYRGEEERVSENKKLGRFVLDIERRYLGECRVLVACIFELNINGELVFQAVQMPFQGAASAELERLFDNARENQSKLDLVQLEDLISKYNFQTDQISLKV